MTVARRGDERLLFLILLYLVFGPVVLAAVPVLLVLWLVLTPFRLGGKVIKALAMILTLPVRLVTRLV